MLLDEREAGHSRMGARGRVQEDCNCLALDLDAQP